MNQLGLNMLWWPLAALLALVLAVVGPNESSVMGRLPALTAKRLDQRTVVLPGGLDAERTLALIGFDRRHRAEIESWIEGLNLHHDSAIAWVRMPVLNDPGNPAERQAIESRLLSRFNSPWERARLLPLFTDREAFIRAAGLSGSEHAHAVVFNRQGEVLARVEGPFDPDKAQSLREHLQLAKL